MKSTLIPATLFACAFTFNSHAALSQLNATCPGNLEVHVDQGGPVYINGKEATLKRSNDNYYEARDAKLGVTISISNNPDGTSDVTYTGKNRANGVCKITGTSTASNAAAPVAKRETHPASERACLAAVAKKTNVNRSRLSVIEALGGEAGILVKVKVPGADAPWACTTDQKGKPWNVSYTGSEGKL
jgi:hypothetical protein